MSAQPELTFNEELHEYRLGDRKMHAVTDVLRKVLQTNSKWWNDPKYRIRGSFVHAITQAVAEGDWDPEATTFPSSWTPDETRKVINRGRAFEQYQKDVGLQVIHSEMRLYSELLGIAGTLDHYGNLTRGMFAGKSTIIDVKSGDPTPAARLQVALYQILLPKDLKCDVRIVLHLREDGTYRTRHYTGQQDLKTAMSVIEVFQYMQEEGI